MVDFQKATQVLIGATPIDIPVGEWKKSFWVNVANNSIAGNATGTAVSILPGGATPATQVAYGQSESVQVSPCSWVRLSGNGANVTYIVGTQQVAIRSVTVSPSVSLTVSPAPGSGLSLPASGSGTNTAVAVKASAGAVYGWYFFNNNPVVSYVQWFNVAQGSVDVGTTAPAMSFGIPPNSGANVLGAVGIVFSTAITVAFTTTPTGGSAPTTNVDYNIFFA